MDQVSQVREKIDIVTLISEYVPLKKTGRNFKAPCPFHSEKTPSFVVSPERQIWHCFGCNLGGDCFTFLMQYENLEFPEALRTLAKKAGVELVQSVFQTGVSSKKEKIYTLNKEAAAFYHYVLTKHSAGKKALAYIKDERGIKDRVIETFMLGFAPFSGNALTNYLINKKKHAKEDLIEAGLAFQKSEGLGDFFVNRIMFPLYDHRGNVEGFSGRLMIDDQKSSKYINTRETLVYHKGSVFFGLNIAKDEIKKENNAIIMEGEFDVLSSFQIGIGNVVAVKGTALTEQQVSLIARFAQKVSLCFDTDRAGKEAIIRSLAPLEKKGVTTTVILPPGGKDPDEAVQKNPSYFKQAVKNDTPVYDYLLEQSVANVDLGSAEDKKRATDYVLPILSNIENEVVKEHYLKKLATALDTSYESVVRQLQHLAEKQNEDIVLKRIKDQRPRREVLEEYLLGLLLQYAKPLIAYQKVQSDIKELSFSLPAYQKIVQALASYAKKHDVFDQKAFQKILPPELLAAFDRCCLLPTPAFANEKAFLSEAGKVVKELSILAFQQQLKSIGEEIKKIEKEGGNNSLDLLHAEFSRFTTLLSDAQKK